MFPVGWSVGPFGVKCDAMKAFCGGEQSRTVGFGVVVDLEDLNEIMTDSGFVLRIRTCCLRVMNSV